MLHPIRTEIESLHRGGKCPRLQVDVTHEDAVCPDFVRDKWKERLVIDLDPSYPLDLAFTEVGVEADLSFGGHVSRCVFPWDAIRMVINRDTGKGKVFQQAPRVAALDPELTAIRDDDRAVGKRRRKRRRGSKQDPAEAIEAAHDIGESNDSNDSDSGEAEPEPSTPSSRRAAFRVIDGDG